jgi:tRNA(adenine34) deaminase
VVASAYDTVERDDDRSSHPETMLVKACHELGRDLSGCTLYTTTEPCAMCFTTAWLAGVSQIVFGTTMDEVRRHTSGIVEWVFVPAEWLNARTIRPVTLLGGVLRGECLSLFDAATVKGSV